MSGKRKKDVSIEEKSAGSVARKALQSLEQIKLIEKGPDGGRKLTIQGRRDLDRIAAQVPQKKKQKELLLAQQAGITITAPAAPVAETPVDAPPEGSW